jgi:hypothetical protein
MKQSLVILEFYIVQKCRGEGREFATPVAQYLRTDSTEENRGEY